MNFRNKAVRIQLGNFSSAPMRAFHMTWLAFSLCFFGWFGLSPLLQVIREDLGITTDQIVTANMVAVGSTVLMRVGIGWLCDRYGPRLTYTWLLILGALPVAGVGLAQDYETFLIMRMLIGAIGASFVITQYHTTIMFAPNCVGTANATTAGWGNLGGGVAQLAIPFIYAGVLTLVGDAGLAWRWTMVIPGVMMIFVAIAYYMLTQDAPDGNFSDLRAKGELEQTKSRPGTLLKACSNYRIWLLFLAYGACFGVELTLNANVALYFMDNFKMDMKTAGIIAGLFGLVNLFARSLGGFLGDRFGINGGLKGRVRWLGLTLLGEGLTLMIFARMDTMLAIIVSLVIFSLFVQMAEGATYSLLPFVDKKNLGSSMGIVGAGGNVGAVSALFLFKQELTGLTWPSAFFVMGIAVALTSLLVPLIRFSAAAEHETKIEIDVALAARRSLELTT